MSRGKLTLTAIAKEIADRLRELEKDPQHKYRVARRQTGMGLFNANAWQAGPRVRVRYISFQGDGSVLTRDQALLFLEYLRLAGARKHFRITCADIVALSPPEVKRPTRKVRRSTARRP